MRILIIISLIGANLISFAQSQQYSTLVASADSLFKLKQYKTSAELYTRAFKVNGWKGTLEDRYNAACSWALANNADSSFSQLARIVTKGSYKDYEQITTDKDLNTLHADKRWSPLLAMVKKNKEKAEANLNKPLAQHLDSIYIDDQKYRQQMSEVEKKFGWNSNEMKTLWQTIGQHDSVNLIKVKAVLDKYGWLGPDVVGDTGAATLFLVIQHSPQVVQEKYLPMMRDAVKKGNADGIDLALLEDRVALRQGKMQVYGSQIARDPETQQYYVQPLEDPDHVDQRRAAVGLPPMAEYIGHWQLVWNVEQYKKELPAIMKKHNIIKK